MAKQNVLKNSHANWLWKHFSSILMIIHSLIYIFLLYGVGHEAKHFLTYTKKSLHLNAIQIGQIHKNRQFLIRVSQFRRHFVNNGWRFHSFLCIQTELLKKKNLYNPCLALISLMINMSAEIVPEEEKNYLRIAKESVEREYKKRIWLVM